MASEENADQVQPEISASLQPIAQSKPARPLRPGERRNVLLLAGTPTQVSKWRAAWQAEVGKVIVLQAPQDTAALGPVNPPWQLDVLPAWEADKETPTIVWFRDWAQREFDLSI
jgi:hypothetical protein